MAVKKTAAGFGERMNGGVPEVFRPDVNGIVRFARTARPPMTADAAVAMAKDNGLSAADQKVVRKRVAAR